MAAPSLLSGFPKTSGAYSTPSGSVLLVWACSSAVTAVSGHGLTWTHSGSFGSGSNQVHFWTAWAASALASAMDTVTGLGAGEGSLYAFSGASQTLGASGSAAAATVSLTCSAESQILFAASDAGRWNDGMTGAAGCSIDNGWTGTDGDTYSDSGANGHRTAATSGAGSYTVGVQAAVIVAALEILAAGAEPTTGTFARTLGPVVASISGVVAPTGGLAATLGPVVASGAGVFTPMGYTGSIAATLGPVVASAAGAYAGAGSVAATLGPVIASGVGVVAPRGSLARTLGPVVASAAGFVAPVGTLARTLGPVVASASGNVDAPPSRVVAELASLDFEAWGGADSYAGDTKGQICANGAESIGYRVGIGNDGSAGDRVFLTLPAARLIRAPTPTNPVGKAVLRLTALACMSWDYLAGCAAWQQSRTYILDEYVSANGNVYRCRTAGASASSGGGPTGTTENITDSAAHWRYIAPLRPPAPSGVAFRAKTWVSGSGMSATLSGDLGTITAKPIWLSGQTWYDGTTRGNPVSTWELDITSAYNTASQAGTDLKLCLVCELSDPTWTIELVGVDAQLPWAAPAIEVHRFGDTAIDITGTETCCPTIAVTPPGGATLTDIRWSYQDDMTPSGGNWRYLSGVEGHSVTSPFTLPMLEGSTRVHVEVEVDYGLSVGVLVFKRSWKTPQTAAPKLELRSGSYSAGDSPDPNKTTKGLINLRGPAPYPPSSAQERWFVLGKKSYAAWASGTAYLLGDRVTSAAGQVWYCATAGTSGGSNPFGTYSGNAVTIISDGTTVKWTNERDSSTNPYTHTDTPGDRWRIAIASNYADDWAFRFPGGGLPPVYSGVTGNGDDPLPWPFPTNGIWPDPAGEITMPGPMPGAMAFDCIDVSHPNYEPVSGYLTYLTSHLVAGSYEVRLNMVLVNGENCYWPASGSQSCKGEYPIHQGVKQWALYTSTASPNLKALGDTGRAADWRNCIRQDWYPPFLAAFVADGYLRCYSLSFDWQGHPWINSNAGATAVDLTPVAVSGITDVRFHSLLWSDGGCRTALVAVGSGTGWASMRTPDGIGFDTAGGGHTRYPGSWQTPITGTLARSWPTETLPLPASGHIPDSHSAALALQYQDGSVKFYKSDMTQCSGGAPGLAPAADFMSRREWNRNIRCVGAWPTLTGSVVAWADCANGGQVRFRASGSTLYAQRVQDWCRVSVESSVDVGQTIDEILISKHQVWEGERIPVVVHCADSAYRVVLVTVGVDVSHLYLPTSDQQSRFTTGSVTASSVVKDSNNQRPSSAFKKLPGHNVLLLDWEFDREPDGNLVPNQNGIMNHTGWNYFRLSGVLGERVKLIVMDSPAFGGKWTYGTLWQTSNTGDYLPEAMGGAEWNVMNSSTWFYTYDSPNVAHRNWHRVLDGMDYVLDGETQGGAYIISHHCQANDVWFSHDIVADIPSWKGAVAAWIAGDTSGLISRTDANGVLLGSGSSTPLSHLVTMP